MTPAPDSIIAPTLPTEQASSPAAQAEKSASAKLLSVQQVGAQSTLTEVESLEDLDAIAREQGYTIIQVGINRALYSSFDYKLQGSFDKSIIGARVKVSFGLARKANDVALIVGIGAQSNLPLAKLKEAVLLDDKPVIVPDVMATMRYAAAYYHYPLGQAVQLAIPQLLREGSEASYKKVPGIMSNIEPSMLTVHLKKLRSLAHKELLTILQSGPRKNTELKEQGFNPIVAKALIKKGLAKSIDYAAQIEAFDLAQAAANDELLASEPLKLNTEQQDVLTKINAAQGFAAFLLNGVTGSGKTEVYLQAIEHTLKQGKRALVLVPEISLTPQTFKRFYQRFKVPIATMHSSLSQRERLDAFMDMYISKAAILIGTRSALFSPIENLGLIVIDEEHDSSFKQSDGLRYHARTLAYYRAQINHCTLILGSATPSLESVYACEQGIFTRLDMRQRAKSATLPRMHLIDLRKDELKENVLAGVGEVVEKAVGVVTAQHQQALLFLNRRGFSHSLICPHCGMVLMCPHCDVPLTLHKESQQMRCHTCSSVYPVINYCPECYKALGKKLPLIDMGVGTEQVASYLKERFMDVGIERIDRDVITSSELLDASLKRILNHDSEILIGTQMLSKGHDFPDVTMVGILDADGGLYCDDFRGFEYTAQLITQVAGRAGRADKEGDVYIQTRHPEHLLLQALVAPNFHYLDLAEQLLAIRKEKLQPPYSHQAYILVNSADRNLAFYTLSHLMDTVHQQAASLLGEAKPTIILSDRTEKRFSRYHFHCAITASTRQSLDKVLEAILDVYEHMKVYKDVRFAIDVDPIYSA